MKKPQYTWFKVEEMSQNHLDILRGGIKPLESHDKGEKAKFSKHWKNLMCLDSGIQAHPYIQQRIFSVKC